MKLFTVLCITLLFVIAPSTAQEANLDACVQTYDAGADYFPHKVELSYTNGFEVDYFNNYKVVTVTEPWPGAPEDAVFQYVLVQCGTPAPEGYDDATIIEIPVQTVATMSTTYLPYIASYDLLDKLVGVDTLSTATNPEVIAKGEAGELVELAPNFQLNIEVAVELNPDLIFAYGFGGDTESYQQLLNAGLTVAINGEFAETTPLARAEWGKFIALFFNREAEANEQFDAVAEEYEALKALAATASERPTVFLNTPFEGTWYMAGGESYMAQFLEDANSQYLWSDDESTGTLFLDFESVFERASTADYWLNVNQFWFMPDDVLKEDERYAEFAAYQKGNVWSNNLALTDNFGNDFYESGVAYPNRILADIIAILHPELLSDHNFTYYRRINTGGSE